MPLFIQILLSAGHNISSRRLFKEKKKLCGILHAYPTAFLKKITRRRRVQGNNKLSKFKMIKWLQIDTSVRKCRFHQLYYYLASVSEGAERHA